MKAVLKIQEAQTPTVDVLSPSEGENSPQITAVVQIRSDYSCRGRITSIQDMDLFRNDKLESFRHD